MYGFLEELTDDEYALVMAKVNGAILAQRIVVDKLSDLLDGLEDDYPYRERIMVPVEYGNPDFHAEMAMANAMSSAGATLNKHEATRRDLVDLVIR
jgi:hypothetical protein